MPMRIFAGRKRKLWTAAVVLLLIIYWFSLPSPLFNSPLSTVVLSSDGRLIGARLASDGQWRFSESDSVPVKFAECLTTFEDRYFFYHPGVNLFSLARAAWQDVRAGKIVSGGSTITMQVARMSSGHRRRSFVNKLLEIVMATRIELSYSKAEILKMYAANAPFGGNIVGLDAASRRYFNRPPYKLSWAETATLAVLPNAPSLIYPGKNQLKLLAKRNRLLKKLLKEEKIDRLTYELSLKEKLPQKVFSLPDLAPRLSDKMSMEKRGEIVRTTLDYDLQKTSAAILDRYSRRLASNNIRNAALIIAEVNSGKILAYHGNLPHGVKNDNPGAFVDVAVARRSSGSTLKPLLYCALFDKGLLLPQMLVPDVPTQIGGYKPENFHHEYDGLVPAAEALARSLNIPAVRLLRRLGTQRFLDLLRKTGFTTIDRSAHNYGLSLILGGAEVTLFELSGVYASMARVLNNYNLKGYRAADWHPLYFENSALELAPKNKIEKIFSVSALSETMNALLDVNRPAGESGWKLFSCTEPIAWKTGTSYGFRDAWSVGVTPKYVVGVWVGNADGEGRPAMTGLSSAAPLMFKIFDVLPDTAWFTVPRQEMIKIKICKQSGYRAGPYCMETEEEYLGDKAIKTPLCPYHKLLHLDPSGRYRVNSSCEDVSKMIHKPWFVLPPVYEHYYKAKNPSYIPPPPLRPDCRHSSSKVMDFIYPPPRMKIFVPKDFTGKLSKVVFKASHARDDAVIFWHLDNTYIGSTKGIHEMSLQPSPGKHRITLLDNYGNSIERIFEIVGKN